MKREIWKWVEGYEELYKISNYGRVLSMERKIGRLNRFQSEHLLKPVANQRGYLRVGLTDDCGVRKMKSVHTLVLTTFTGPRPKGMEGCHRDDDKTNNFVKNLFWGTHKKNVRSAIRNGRWGSRLKLTEDDVLAIRKLTDKGKWSYGSRTAIKIARKFNVSPALVRLIHQRKTWNSPVWEKLKHTV